MIRAIIAKRKVRDAFSHFNDRNMEKFLVPWSENATFTYPGTFSVSGTQHGKAAVSGWFRNLMDCGPSVHFSLKSICVSNLFDLIGNNVVTVEWDNSVTNREGANMVVKGVTVIRTKLGKIVEVRDYIFDLDCLPTVWCD